MLRPRSGPMLEGFDSSLRVTARLVVLRWSREDRMRTNWTVSWRPTAHADGKERMATPSFHFQQMPGPPAPKPRLISEECHEPRRASICATAAPATRLPAGEDTTNLEAMDLARSRHRR